MNVEEIQDFCLSLGSDVEEKLPFTKFKNGEGVLVFYVCGHMFCFFDLPKHWIGLDPHSSPDDLTRDLIRNSYEIVKAKYTKKEL